jgi:hypothetical protein
MSMLLSQVLRKTYGVNEMYIFTRQDRHVGMRGSRSSCSLIFCKNLKVAPRIYSLGCCLIDGKDSESLKDA